jgi:hypothetical protein
MENLNIEAFNPTKAELARLVETTKKLELPDPFDVEQLVKIGDARKDLKKTRVTIEKTGKAMRDDANKFAKAVIAKEHELIDIIEPEEIRLEKLEEFAAMAKTKREREALLPERKRRIEAIKDGRPLPTDEELLEYDGPMFEGYYNTRVYDRNQKQERELAAEREKLDAERREADRKRELAEAEERGRREAQERHERAEREAEERRQREETERAERAERDRLAQEARERAEREALEADEKYQAFLKEFGWTEETAGLYRIERTETHVALYKHVATLRLK